MAKTGQKAGRFGSQAKTIFQQDLRFKELDQLKKQDQLSQRESKMLSASQALTPSRGYQKAGRSTTQSKTMSGFDMPNMSLGNFEQEQSFDLMLQTTNKIPVASLINNQSKTGVLSQKDITGAVNTFADKVKNLVGVKSVDVKRTDGKISEIDIAKDYQKTTFQFNPMNLTFATKGWELDIPDTFIKVTDTLYKAPDVEYRASYDKQRDDRSRVSSTTGYYSPVEIKLQDGGDKIAQILKRDVYTKSAQYDDYDYGYRTQKQDAVYTSEMQNFFGTGLLKDKREWDDYIKNYDYERYDRDNSREKIERDTYLKNEWLYNQMGFLTSSKNWGTYKPYDYSFRGTGDNRYERDERYAQNVFLTQEEKFDDRGKITQRKRWDDYRRERDQESRARGRYDDQWNAVMLKSEEYFDAGKKLADLKYKTYLSDVDSRTTNRVVAVSQDGKIVGDTTRTQVARSPTLSAKYDNTFLVDYTGASANERYDAALQKITYYDPVSGEILQMNKFW